MKINLPTHDPTIVLLDRTLELTANARLPREYLGMSQIGHECDRNLFYSFRWAFEPDFDSKTLRRFEDGHHSEEVMARRLAATPGIELYTIDPDTGEQFRFTDHGGHFSGHMDGAIKGLLQAPKAWHVWEHKCVGDDGLEALRRLKEKAPDQKDVLSDWSLTYYAQAVLYMDYSGMDRHYLTVDSSGSRQTLTVRTEANPQEAARLRGRAHRIITINAPPERVSDDPTFFKCRMCPAANVCHGYKMPEVNCRTCTHSTPDVVKGGWFCERHKKGLNAEEQRAACDQHTYLPTLLEPYGIKPVDSDGSSVTYMTKGMNTLRIGPGADAMPSTSARKLVPLVADELLDAARRLGGQIADPEANDLAGHVVASADEVLGLIRHNDHAQLSDTAKKAISRGEAHMVQEGNDFVARDAKGQRVK